MISSYVLSVVSLFMILTMLLQVFVSSAIVAIPPLTFLILTSIVYCFTETLIIFFFVGTGVSVRDYSKENNLPDRFRRKSLEIKFRIYPPTMLNLLLMIILFILPGVVHAEKIPGFVFKGYFLICLGHFVYTKVIQHQCFRQNTDNILAMSGVARTT